MSVEQVVDTYLQMAQQILGDPSTIPAVPAPAATVAGLPRTDWTGNAAQAAASASTALVMSRLQLNNSAADAHAATDAAAQIGRGATLQLQGIVNDWGAAKAAAAATPQPLRDSALIQAGQLHIAEAMGLIQATAARYSAAAADVHAATAALPHPTANDPEKSPPPPPSDTTATTEAGGDPAGNPPAVPTPSPAALAAPAADAGGLTRAAPEAEMMPLQSMAAPMTAPMPSPIGSPMTAPMAQPMPFGGSMIPTTAAGPLSSLGGLASQLANPTPTTTMAGDGGDTIQRHHRAAPGSVDAAIDVALDELGITDPAARARWHAGYDTLIARESAGKVHAVNLTDSNAHGPVQADGAPAGASRGLTQLVPETFRRYRLPGLPNDIYDPVANIVASMRYVMDRHHVDPSAINLTANVQQANRHLPAKGY